MCKISWIIIQGINKLIRLFFLVFENKDKIVIVMECASKGELYDYISERRRLSERETRHFFRQIVSAVHYCHKVCTILISLLSLSQSHSLLRESLMFHQGFPQSCTCSYSMKSGRAVWVYYLWLLSDWEDSWNRQLMWNSFASWVTHLNCLAELSME